MDLVHKYNGSMILSAQNLQVAEFQRSKFGGRPNLSAGHSICRDAMDHVYKYNGSPNLSAQNLQVAKFQCSESAGRRN